MQLKVLHQCVYAPLRVQRVDLVDVDVLRRASVALSSFHPGGHRKNGVLMPTCTRGARMYEGLAAPTQRVPATCLEGGCGDGAGRPKDEKSWNGG